MVLHLRPSCDQVTSDLLERRALQRRHRLRVVVQVGRSMRQRCRVVEQMRASCRTAAFFPLATQ